MLIFLQGFSYELSSLKEKLLAELHKMQVLDNKSVNLQFVNACGIESKLPLTYEAYKQQILSWLNDAKENNYAIVVVTNNYFWFKIAQLITERDNINNTEVLFAAYDNSTREISISTDFYDLEPNYILDLFKQLYLVEWSDNENEEVD